jgi:hypothetical protein
MWARLSAGYGYIGGGAAGLVVVIVLILALLGRCGSFHLGAVATRSTPSPSASTSPEAVASPSPEASPSASPTAAPTDAPTPTPTAAPTATPTAGPPAVAITSVPWHVGEVGVAYAPVSATASGGTRPFVWSISAGSLPAGLSLSSGGTVSGTPQATGGQFTLRVDDSAGQAAGIGTSINIAPALALNPLCGGKGCAVEDQCTNACGSYASQSGGVGPYKYALSSGAPPTGTSLNGLSLAGTFKYSRLPFNFSVTAFDALGATAPVSATYSVFQHLFVADSQGGGPFGGTAVVSMAYSYYDGSGTITSVTIPKLPNKYSWTYDAVKSVITVTIQGIGPPTTPPPYQVVVTDSHPCGPGARCSYTATMTLSNG